MSKMGSQDFWQWVIAVTGLCGAALSAYWGKRASEGAAKTRAEADQKVAKQQAEASPYKELATRTSTLERQVVRVIAIAQSLQADFHTVADVFTTLVDGMDNAPPNVVRAVEIIERQRMVREHLIERALSEPGDGQPDDGKPV